MIKRIDPNKILIPLKDVKEKHKKNVNPNLTPEEFKEYSGLIKDNKQKILEQYQKLAEKALEEEFRIQDAEDNRIERESYQKEEELSSEELQKILEKIEEETASDVIIKKLPKEWQDQIKSRSKEQGQEMPPDWRTVRDIKEKK